MLRDAAVMIQTGFNNLKIFSFFSFSLLILSPHVGLPLVAKQGHQGKVRLNDVACSVLKKGVLTSVLMGGT